MRGARTCLATLERAQARHDLAKRKTWERMPDQTKRALMSLRVPRPQTWLSPWKWWNTRSVHETGTTGRVEEAATSTRILTGGFVPGRSMRRRLNEVLSFRSDNSRRHLHCSAAEAAKSKEEANTDIGGGTDDADSVATADGEVGVAERER